MTVNITWKLSGSAVTAVDHGSGTNGDSLTTKVLFIEHDGLNQLTECKFWIDAKISDYTGNLTPAADLAEIKAWGDQETEDAFGGFFISMNAVGSFPTWPVYGTKLGTDYFTFCTGTGDSIENGVTLHTNMNSTPAMSSSGIIPASCSIWPSFACRVHIPAEVDTVGIRQFVQKLRFTYTS